ncbi:MAG: hypothetical protein IPL61_33395 [Myxococcales bacterium]|nr:hypothetical protein [Myxococcales bacterium]
MAALAIVGLALAGCGEKRETQPARTEPLGRVVDAGAAAPTGPDGGDLAPIGTDDDTAAATPPGSIAAWQAVIDRDRYLARRGQGAVIVGRIGGEAIAPGARGVIRWLVDETEGNGALAVRVAIAGAPPAEGARVAVRGAWALDSQRRWYWQAEALTPVTTPPPAALPEPPLPPGHQLTSGPPPSGYRAVSRGKDGGVIVFGVIRSSNGDDDGWVIGDDSFSLPIANLTLPGERSSYGGHDLRHDDERWQLKRGVLYWVRIDRYRRKTPDARAYLRALTAPVKVQ